MTEKEKIIHEWYDGDANYNSKLDKLVEKLIKKYGGLYQKDLDDFKSIANYVFTDVLNRWDGVRTFKFLLYGALENKFKTEMRDRNRLKNGGTGGLVVKSKYDNTTDPTGELRYREKEWSEKNRIETSSLEYEEQNDTSPYELIRYGDTVEDVVFKEDENCFTENGQKVFDSLSRKQRRILTLKMNGKSADEICKESSIKYGDYLDLMARIRANDKVRELFLEYK